MPLKNDQLYRLEFRAFGTQENKMYNWEEHRNLILTIMRENHPGYTIMQWIGHFDDSPEHKKIYQGDICEAEILNEFNSVSIAMGVIVYNVDICSNEMQYGSIPAMYEKTVAVKVIGNIYQNAELARPIIDQLREKNGSLAKGT